MTAHTHSYVPALAYDALTPLYDLLMALTMRERAFKQRLVEQTGLRPGMRVLDVGCGTGTLAIMLAAAEPQAEIVGLDPDARILGIARDKAARADARIAWVEGSAVAPPFPAASFDRATSTLVVHHLTTAEKKAAFAALRTVLRPGGELHIADFGKPHTLYAALAAAAFRWFDGAERTSDNLAGRLPELLRAAGFDEATETERWTTAFGTLSFLRARVSAGR